MREQNHHVNPFGLSNLARKIRPVGAAYKELIANWREVLPTQSVCLRVPIVMPSEHAEEWAQRSRAQARADRTATPTAPANADQ